MTDEIRRTLGRLRTAANRVGFLLQLGDFKHSGKFFDQSTFRQRDIKYVSQQLNLSEIVDLATYQPFRMSDHQARILMLQGWTAFDSTNASLIAEHVQLKVQQQLKPEQVFAAAVDFCWQQRIELPSHNQLAEVITDSFNIVESALLNQLEISLDSTSCESLDVLLKSSDGLRPALSDIKLINQSLRTKDMQRNVDACQTFARYYQQFEVNYTALEISENATEYYATWVKKATLGQLKQFPNRFKRYLYLFAFIKYEYCIRQDVLMDTVLSSTRSAVNAARKQEDQGDLERRSDQRKAIRAIKKSQTARHLLDEITRVVRGEQGEPSVRLIKVEQLLNDYEAIQSTQDIEKLNEYGRQPDQHTDAQRSYDSLERQSVRLQRKASSILNALVFDKSSSESPILNAVSHFQTTDGQLGQ